MNYNTEFLQYQKVFGGTLKRKYKSITKVEVNPKDFEEIMEYNGDYPPTLLGINITWRVRVAIKENESFSGLSSLGQDLFHSMFKIKGVVPWINMETDYGN